MRVFVAINVPESIKEKLVDVQKLFNGLGKITFVSRNKMHITLKFFSSIQPRQVEILKERLQKISFNSFHLELSGLGVFDDLDYIRVLWVGVKSKQIYRLQSEIDRELQDIFNADKRFHAHITLGRVKNLSDKDMFKEALKTNIKGSFNVTSFKLIRSEPTSQGHVYSILEDYHLKQ